MEGRAGDGGGGDDFAEAADTVGGGKGGARGAADVDVDGGVVLGGEPEHLEDFPVGGGVRVCGSNSHGGGSAAETFFDEFLDLFDFNRGGGAVGGGPGGEERAGVVHDGHADRRMADGGSIVEDGFSGAGGVPGVDVRGTDLEFEGGGDSVHDLIAAGFGILAMPVEVDEARADDQASSVDGGAAGERGLADGGDFSAVDSDVAWSIEVRFGVKDAASGDDGVEGLRLREEGGQEKEEDPHAVNPCDWRC